MTYSKTETEMTLTLSFVEQHIISKALAEYSRNVYQLTKNEHHAQAAIDLESAYVDAYCAENEDTEDYKFEGYDLFRLEHPKLYGRWEIWLNEKEYVGRAVDLNEAKEMVINHKRGSVSSKPLFK